MCTRCASIIYIHIGMQQTGVTASIPVTEQLLSLASSGSLTLL